MRHFWLCLLLLAGPAAAGVPHWSLIDLIQQADAVVHGRVVELREDTAVVAVTGTWKRNLGTERIVVAPITVRHCVGVSPNMKVAEEVVLMLGIPERGCYRVVAGGYGKIAGSAGERTGLLGAVDQLV